MIGIPQNQSLCQVAMTAAETQIKRTNKRLSSGISLCESSNRIVTLRY
jgi:hypothetical protein